MDPTTTVNEILQVLEQMKKVKEDQPFDVVLFNDLFEEIVEKTTNLNQWLTKGGYQPDNLPLLVNLYNDLVFLMFPDTKPTLN